MNAQPNPTLKILQLLLRCGMVCQEELNVVLEMMAAVPGSQAVAVQESAPHLREAPESQP